MSNLIQQENTIIASFQSVFGNEELLFQVAELFPIPIQIFDPDGTTVFASRAVLEMWNISDPSQIVGVYNLKKDPVVNERLGLKDYVRRAFEGEIVLVHDVRVPLEDFSVWYQPRNSDYSIRSMYTDILNFPILDVDGKIMTRGQRVHHYQDIPGKSMIALSQRVHENHWQEPFDMDKVAGSVSLSRYHFAGFSKANRGDALLQLLSGRQNQETQRSARDTNLTISEVFAACGMEYNGSLAGVI